LESGEAEIWQLVVSDQGQARPREERKEKKRRQAYKLLQVSYISSFTTVYDIGRETTLYSVDLAMLCFLSVDSNLSTCHHQSHAV
jgi:hypothetical protein